MILYFCGTVKCLHRSKTIEIIARINLFGAFLMKEAIISNSTRDTLWAELPASYDEDSITTYRNDIYEYIYMRYRTAA